jgi:hypothetical protein
MLILDSKWEEDDFFKEMSILLQIGMTPISPIGLQRLSPEPRIISVMGGIGGIVILWIIFFQVLRLRLRVDKDETAFPALYHLKPAGNSIEPVPSLKKKAMLIRTTNFTRNRFHFLSHFFCKDHRGDSLLG